MSILIAFFNGNSGGRMKWFKHYSTAEFSESLSNIEENFGFEGLGRYWRFMEFLSRQLENDDVSFRIQRAKIRELLRFRSWNDLETFVDQLRTVRGMEVDRSGNVYEIKAPILLELQQKDFKKTRQDRGEDAAKNKKENKIKIKDKEEEAYTSVDLHPLASAWNQHCGKLPKVEVLNSERLKKSKALLKKHSLEDLIAAITRIQDSDFCNGGGSQAWVATFDFFIKPNSYAKIVEGQYDARIQRKPLSKSDNQLSEIAQYVANLED